MRNIVGDMLIMKVSFKANVSHSTIYNEGIAEWQVSVELVIEIVVITG